MTAEQKQAINQAVANLKAVAQAVDPLAEVVRVTINATSPAALTEISLIRKDNAGYENYGVQTANLPAPE